MWDWCPCQRWRGALGVLGPGSSPLHTGGARGEGRCRGEHIYQRTRALQLPRPCGGCSRGASSISPCSFPGRPSLLSPRLSRERTLGSGRSDTLPIAPRPAAAAQGALEVPHWATLPAQEVRTGPQLPPPPPLCKLFAKAFISVATPPCARVSVATPSRRTGPSDASRRAAHVLRRDLRKAPLCPRFGGFLFFPIHPRPPHPRPLRVHKGIELCPFSAPPPGTPTDAPWDGSGGWHGVQYPKLLAPARGFDWAGGPRSGSCPQSLPQSSTSALTPVRRGRQGSSPLCTVLLSPEHLEG